MKSQLLLSTRSQGIRLRPGVGRERPRGVGVSGQSVCCRPQVSAAEDGTITRDRNVVLEIPAGTTIACGVIELYVKLDGLFGECCPCSGLWGDEGRPLPRGTHWWVIPHRFGDGDARDPKSLGLSHNEWTPGCTPVR